MYYKTHFRYSEKLWLGPDIVPLYNPNLSVGQAVLDALDKTPDKICQISADTGYQMTTREMQTLIIRGATNFRTKTLLKKGEVVTVVAKNSKNVAPLVFAGLLSGISISTMDPNFDVTEMTHSLAQVKPKLVFCDKDNREIVEKSLLVNDIKAEVHVIADNMALLLPNDEEAEFLPPNLGDISALPAIILCSSGTTGLPKGVCISHPLLLVQLRRQWRVTTENILFSFSSLYWLSGWLTLINGTLNGATRVITTNSYSPNLLIDLIENFKITDITSAPYQMMLLLESARDMQVVLKSVRTVFVGGSFVSDSLREGLKKILPNGAVYVAYGCSEISGFISATLGAERDGSVGQIAPGITVKIVDDDGNMLGCNKTGEICAKSYYPFLGYFNNPTAVANDQDGFIQTGDLGYFDKDGFLFCVDRKKEILKYSNQQIAPTEIEEVILKIPGVVATVVVGVPDKIVTDLPAALIVRNNENLTEKFVQEFVAGHVPDYKCLRGGVYFVEKLPLTHSGKVKRPEAKQIASKRYGEIQEFLL